MSNKAAFNSEVTSKSLQGSLWHSSHSSPLLFYSSSHPHTASTYLPYKVIHPTLHASLFLVLYSLFFSLLLSCCFCFAPQLSPSSFVGFVFVFHSSFRPSVPWLQPDPHWYSCRLAGSLNQPPPHSVLSITHTHTHTPSSFSLFGPCRPPLHPPPTHTHPPSWQQVGEVRPSVCWD